MELKIKLKPPMMPNFVSYDLPPRKKQDGIDFSKVKIPISDFSREQAEQYGQLMKDTFIAHWEKSQS